MGRKLNKTTSFRREVECSVGSVFAKLAAVAINIGANELIMSILQYIMISSFKRSSSSLT